MKRRHGFWRQSACLLALATPALAQTPAASPATPAATPAPAAPTAPATPAPAAPTAPAAPATPAAPAPTTPAAATPAPPASADLQLAPDPKLAPAIPLAPAPAAFDASADAYPALPDVPLGGSNDVALTDVALTDAALTPLLDLRLAFRDQLIGGDGFDTFSEDDQLPTFQLAAGLCLLNLVGDGAIAGVASLELSGTSSNLRGLPTELDVLRIGLGPELRWPLAERIYVSGRLSPQAVRVSSELDQWQANDLRFSQAEWAFGIDASVGAAVRIAQLRPRGLDRPLGVFLHLEAGYLWTSSVELELTAGSNGPVRSAPLQLGELSLHGVSLGGGIGIGY